MAKPTAIGKPTVQEEDKASLLKGLDAMLKLVNEGEVGGIVAITVRPDRSFAIYQLGDLRRIETIGLLEQAQFDLLTSEPPYPGKQFKPGA
jgi:hypothetical protein